MFEKLFGINPPRTPEAKARRWRLGCLRLILSTLFSKFLQKFRKEAVPDGFEPSTFVLYWKCHKTDNKQHNALPTELRDQGLTTYPDTGQKIYQLNAPPLLVVVGVVVFILVVISHKYNSRNISSLLIFHKTLRVFHDNFLMTTALLSLMMTARQL